MYTVDLCHCKKFSRHRCILIRVLAALCHCRIVSVANENDIKGILVHGVPEKLHKVWCTATLQPWVTASRGFHQNVYKLIVNMKNDTGHSLNIAIKYSLFGSWWVNCSQTLMQVTYFHAGCSSCRKPPYFPAWDWFRLCWLAYPKARQSGWSC